MPKYDKITVRCTPLEYRLIAERAREYGMDMSNFIRFMCLNATPEVKAPSK
jgi:hypothetical protein